MCFCFADYLQNNYADACDMQINIHIHLDQPMVDMLQLGPYDAVLVRAWMRQYGLFQGITRQQRIDIANRFLQFAQDQVAQDQVAGDQVAAEPDAGRIQALYGTLLHALHNEVPRSWVSATSKLLWCLYPNTIIIYDAFVHRALVVMQCIDDDLRGFPRIGTAPPINAELAIANAVQHYMNYQCMVRRLLQIHALRLQDLGLQHNNAYPYDVRIMDKVLWMIGNPNFPHHGEV